MRIQFRIIWCHIFRICPTCMGSGHAEENPHWMCLGCFGRGTWAMWHDNNPWPEFNHIPGWRGLLFG